MKIAITATKKEKGSNIDPRFGRTHYFLILNDDGKVEEIIDNQAQAAQRGAGISAAQKLENKDVNIIITGNIGPNAFNALSSAGVKVFLAEANITAAEAFKKWEKDKLKEVEKPNVGGHFGEGKGIGRGQGRGRGWGSNN